MERELFANPARRPRRFIDCRYAFEESAVRHPTPHQGNVPGRGREGSQIATRISPLKTTPVHEHNSSGCGDGTLRPKAAVTRHQFRIPRACGLHGFHHSCDTVAVLRNVLTDLFSLSLHRAKYCARGAARFRLSVA